MPIDPETNATTVVRTLRDAGHVAYFAGGCVRDRLLGLEPKDYDVATDAPPERVRELFRKTQAVGAAFGVILVRLGGSMIEVATFRSDGEYADGRRPESVTFSTAEQDAQRRDFTINGLFFDPVESKVIDYVGGQADLAAKMLRAIGDPAARFNEDHLRLLRAVRFAARFGLTIDPATAAAIDAGAPLLPRISAERIADELRRSLTAPTRNAAYRLLLQHGLLAAIFPDDNVGSVNEHGSTFLKLSPDQPISFSLALVALTLDMWKFCSAPVKRRDMFGGLTLADAKAIAQLWRNRLKLSNDESDAIVDIGQWTFAVFGSDRPDDAMLKRMLARPGVVQIRQLLDVIRSTEVPDDRVEQLRPRLDALAAGDVAPPPLVTGDVLISAGFRPGRGFKDILNAVYDAQLNGTVHDIAGAVALAVDIGAGKV